MAIEFADLGRLYYHAFIKMNRTWRYIPPITASGETQMAIDRFLLEQHRRGQPPALRFYTWLPAAISLGYHQQDYPNSWNDLMWQSKPIEIVRRPTGGRAVLHQGDLTYTIVTSIPSGKKLEVYKQICQFLITGWQTLGIELSYGSATREYMQHHNCFATATGSDLVTAEGYKAIGSAQLRRRQTVLQHGSMILNTDKSLYARVFDTELPQTLGDKIFNEKDRSTTYSQDVLTAKIVKSLVQAAIAIFKIDLVEQSFSTTEWQDIANLKNDFS